MEIWKKDAPDAFQINQDPISLGVSIARPLPWAFIILKQTPVCYVTFVGDTE